MCDPLDSALPGKRLPHVGQIERYLMLHGFVRDVDGFNGHQARWQRGRYPGDLARIHVAVLLPPKHYAHSKFVPTRPLGRRSSRLAFLASVADMLGMDAVLLASAVLRETRHYAARTNDERLGPVDFFYMRGWVKYAMPRHTQLEYELRLRWQEQGGRQRALVLVEKVAQELGADEADVVADLRVYLALLLWVREKTHEHYGRPTRRAERAQEALRHMKARRFPSEVGDDGPLRRVDAACAANSTGH